MLFEDKYSITSLGHILVFDAATIDQGQIRYACIISPDFVA